MTDGDVDRVEPVAVPTADTTSGTGAASGHREPAPELPTGATVGRFRIEEPLGRGGMGVVYRASDPDLDRRVALKMVRFDSSAEERRDRLLREAQALAQLSHPNVVAVYEVGTHGDDVFVAMEYAEGVTLRAWQRAAARSRREILDVYCAAGRGLAAAHDVGLVHRDFKPDNVMVGDDGRVRVLDFGLARAASATCADDAGAIGGPPAVAAAGALGRETGSGSLGPNDSVTESQAPSWQTSLTRVGAVVGTPLYMAPEQFAGGPLSPATDQFSFCIALYEALYGERPFRARDPERLAALVCSGEIAAPPRRSRVPLRLRRVLLRGLQVAPERRFPTMRELIAQLERDPARRYRRAALAAALIALAGTSAWAIAREPPSGERCPDPRGELAGAWDAAARQRVQAAFVASGAARADEQFRRVASVLDDYADHWAASRRAACLDTYVRRVRSEALFDLRVSCLERRRAELASFVHLLAEPTPPVIAQALAGAYQLSLLAPCSDADALLAAVAPPADARTRAAVAGLRRELDAATATAKAGLAGDALAIAERALSAARGAGYAPALAEALVAHGALAGEQGSFALGERELNEALDVAARAGDDDVVARAWVTLLGIVGDRQAKFDDAMALRRGAEVAVVRGGDDPELRASLDVGLGRTYAQHGDYGRAREYLERAWVTRQAIHGAEHPAVATLLHDIGYVLLRQGDYGQARGYLERALAIATAALGADHPDTATSQHSRGIVHAELGELDEALARFRAALAIRQRTNNPRATSSQTSIGMVLARQGKLAEARRYYEDALAGLERTYGPEHPQVAFPLQAIGGLLQEQGRYDDALPYVRRGLAVREAALGGEHHFVAESLVAVASSELALGRPARAIPLLERAAAIRRSAGGDEVEAAKVGFALARALWAGGSDRARARRLAREARDVLAKAGERAEPDRALVDRWLAGRR